MSERRIRNNKKRRQQELKRKGIFFILSIAIMVVISTACFGFSSKASDSQKETYYKYYTSIVIQDGDSLWSLAEKNYDGHFKSKKAYIDEIKKINGLSDETLISGQYLIVPYYSNGHVG
ncbi:MAG: LysM peptidoglycan-binding domain-containing protein [Roseburia sp.]|nr:LysM peptidoglycan-binding domain-containing protein [Roseburia sp.]MCM1279182.1 LysM peptidoglycan-binding domain-containing protein [Robinsoniella sp.]